MNTTSNVTPISETPKQPQQRQTFKDIIAANVKSLIEQLEAGHSDALTAYLDAMSRFRSYSFGNVLEIARQKPGASRVAGMYAWNQLGRRVKKGEKGTVLRDAATVYKVDTDAITLKVKQEFAAKTKAKKDAKPVPKVRIAA